MYWLLTRKKWGMESDREGEGFWSRQAYFIRFDEWSGDIGEMLARAIGVERWSEASTRPPPCAVHELYAVQPYVSDCESQHTSKSLHKWMLARLRFLTFLIKVVSILYWNIWSIVRYKPFGRVVNNTLGTGSSILEKSELFSTVDCVINIRVKSQNIVMRIGAKNHVVETNLIPPNTYFLGYNTTRYQIVQK